MESNVEIMANKRIEVLDTRIGVCKREIDDEVKGIGESMGVFEPLLERSRAERDFLMQLKGASEVDREIATADGMVMGSMKERDKFRGAKKAVDKLIKGIEDMEYDCDGEVYDALLQIADMLRVK